MNTSIRGSAADLMKVVMIALERALARACYEYTHSSLVGGPASRSVDAHSPSARPLLQWHDELVLEARACCVPDVADLLRAHMQLHPPVALRVLLPVKLRVGPSLADLTELK